jgi:hypothetical protein
MWSPLASLTTSVFPCPCAVDATAMVHAIAKTAGLLDTA